MRLRRSRKWLSRLISFCRATKSMKSFSILLEMQYSSSLNCYQARLSQILLRLLRYSDCFISMELKMQNLALKRCWPSFFQKMQVCNKQSSIHTNLSTLIQLIMYKKRPRTSSVYLKMPLWLMLLVLRSSWKNAFNKTFSRKRSIIIYGDTTLIQALHSLKMLPRCLQTS